MEPAGVISKDLETLSDWEEPDSDGKLIAWKIPSEDYGKAA